MNTEVALAGYHAVTALGYDSTGVRIENQWSSGWGARGFATLSWSFVDQYVFQATSVGSLVPPAPAPGVSASPVVSGGAARGQTLTGSAGTGPTMQYPPQTAGHAGNSR